MSCPHLGALVYILVLKLRVSKKNTNSVLRVYPWVNRSHVSECSLYKLYSGPVFSKSLRDRLSNNIHCHLCKASHLSTSSLHKNKSSKKVPMLQAHTQAHTHTHTHTYTHNGSFEKA